MQNRKIQNMMLLLASFLAAGVMVFLFNEKTYAAGGDSTSTQMLPFGAGLPVPTVQDQFTGLTPFVNQFPNNANGGSGITDYTIPNTYQGLSNTDVVCGSNSQMAGITQFVATPRDSNYMQTNYNAMPRSSHTIDNYQQISRCDSMNATTLSCDTRDWIYQLNVPSLLVLRCASVQNAWETQGANSNTSSYFASYTFQDI
ncbi:MAG: hypothetical protein JO149_05125 [Gammaproteobacteria bacterium]|nr:hypothetical protein [Gammaproteobacteria bacterium]